eukprot:973759-Rhodomonas_salina.1
MASKGKGAKNVPSSAIPLPLEQYRKDGVLAATNIRPWPTVVEPTQKIDFPIPLARINDLPLRKVKLSHWFDEVYKPGDKLKAQSSTVPVGCGTLSGLYMPPNVAFHYAYESQPAVLFLPGKHKEKEVFAVFAEPREESLFFLLQVSGAVSAVAREMRSGRALREHAHAHHRAERVRADRDRRRSIQGRAGQLVEEKFALLPQAPRPSLRPFLLTRVLLAALTLAARGQLMKWGALPLGPDCCEETFNFLNGVRPSHLSSAAASSSSSSASAAASSAGLSAEGVLGALGVSHTGDGAAPSLPPLPSLRTTLKPYQATSSSSSSSSPLSSPR